MSGRVADLPAEWEERARQFLADAAKCDDEDERLSLEAEAGQARVCAENLRSALSTAPLPVVQGGEPSLDREALGRLAWSIKNSMPAAAFDLLVEQAREKWCLVAEAVASAVRKGEGLTHPDRLKLIADLVSGLPHGPGTPGPGLELGESAEAYALLCGLVGQMNEGAMQDDAQGYACVRISGLWFGASKPKTEGK